MSLKIQKFHSFRGPQKATRKIAYPITVDWRRDTLYSVISKDKRFYIVHDLKKTHCMLYKDNRRVGRSTYDNLQNTKWQVEKILIKEKNKNK